MQIPRPFVPILNNHRGGFLIYIFNKHPTAFDAVCPQNTWKAACMLEKINDSISRPKKHYQCVWQFLMNKAN